MFWSSAYSQTRTRTCSTGTGCLGGSSEESQPCQPQYSAPEWGQWSAWSSCRFALKVAISHQTMSKHYPLMHKISSSNHQSQMANQISTKIPFQRHLWWRISVSTAFVQQWLHDLSMRRGVDPNRAVQHAALSDLLRYLLSADSRSGSWYDLRPAGRNSASRTTFASSLTHLHNLQ